MAATTICKILKGMIAAVVSVLAVTVVSAATPIDYHVFLTAQTSSQSLAPYMLGSWNEGRYAEGDGIWQEAGAVKHLDLDKRFSWSAAIDYIAGAASKTSYDRWERDTQTWTTHVAHMPYFRLQQLYGQLKYRSAFLTLGMKYSTSKIVDPNISSGDVTRSNNAMPVPGIWIGFLDFQNIPFTKGWVQIDGEIMYGKMLDSGFKKAEFNYYSGVEALGIWYHYKRCYFRTNPDKDFHVTVGMQSAGMFGGSTAMYLKGDVYFSEDRGFRFSDVLQMFFPREGSGEAYYLGSHLGSWDLKAVYRFKDNSTLQAYFEWPWEDGSGIGKMNGWDGLWGLQYNFSKPGVISKAVVEYLDFTNQSGPIHYDPDDHPFNPLTGHAQGADDYYNNGWYGAYTNYGMGIGSPFLVAPIYNRSGMLSYLYNRARGFHAGIAGNPSDVLKYRAMVGYEVAGGSGWVPVAKKLRSTSAMIEAVACPFRKVPGMEVGIRVAFDRGALRGDNFGAQIRIGYNGELKF